MGTLTRLKLIAASEALALLSCALVAAGQSNQVSGGPVQPQAVQPVIRVGSDLVVIRVMVMDKKSLSRKVTRSQAECEGSDIEAFLKLGAAEPFLPVDCLEQEVRNLRAADFRLLVEGRGQEIERVLLEGGDVTVRDNLGRHNEHSETPAGQWSTADLPGLEGLLASRYVYNIAFVPSASQGPGCHSMKVKVDRRNALVRADPEYCTSQSPSDILNGTEFGRRMERDLDSDEVAKIPLSLRAGYFYTDAGKARASIAIGFPWEALHRQWEADWTLHATIGVLGMLYKKDKSLATRFSDFACCSGDSSVFAVGWDWVPANVSNSVYEDVAEDLSTHDVKNIPTSYETQIDLPPGDYDLRAVLSDGKKFGRAEVPLNIDDYDGKELGISSVMLCKRYRDAHVAAVEAGAANFAPQYVPLVSKGSRFTPTADASFKQGEPLIPYLEVYEPLLPMRAATTVQAHLRIVDASTGKVIMDFPPVDAAPYERAGSSTIPIAREIPFDQLPKGAYRLEVQATDSAGRSTPWRTADFTVE